MTTAQQTAAPSQGTIAVAAPAPSRSRRLRGSMRRKRGIVLGATSLIAFVLLWEILSHVGILDTFFFSQPTAIAVRAREMFVSDADIYPHLWVSAQEAGLGFVIAVVVGVLTGLVLGRFAVLRELAEPFLVAMYSTPTVAFLPLIVMWLGIGLWSKVLLVFLGAVFMVIINTVAGVQAADPRRIDAARSFKAGDLRIFLEVILPSSIPFIAAGVRLAIGRALIMMFIAELYASVEGIGFLMHRAAGRFEVETFWVGIFVLAAVGVALSGVLRWAEEGPLARFR